MANDDLAGVLERAKANWRRVFHPQHGDFIEACGCINSGVTMNAADSIREVLNCFAGERLDSEPCWTPDGYSPADPDNAALEGYRAATSWIGADSWDGCSDCVAWLKAASAADVRDPFTSNELAAALTRLRPHKPEVPLCGQAHRTEIERENARLREAAQQARHTLHALQIGHRCDMTATIERLDSALAASTEGERG